jgi:acetoacetyl-CoA synthetase
MSAHAEPAVLWTPSEELVEGAHVTAYMRSAAERAGRALTSYDELWSWSVGDLEGFWGSIWERFGVRASAPYERVLEGRDMPGARWFGGARLNYAENLLLAPAASATSAPAPARTAPAAAGGIAARMPRRGEGPVVVHLSELRPLESLTRAELTAQVAAAADGLRALGVVRGDRIVAYMPNIAETLIAFLACASVGAIWSSAAPEMGARSVLDRFAQIEPKVLLAVDGYRYGGRDFDRLPALQALVEGLPSLEHVVLLGYLDAGAQPGSLRGVRSAPRAARAGGPGGDRARAARAGAATEPLAWRWDELLALGEGAAPEFAQVPFEHPLWVLYSSGTTGLPKAIVHSHGGILVEQLKKAYLHLDLHEGDRIFWYTTTAWMMWNFLVGCLVGEAAIVLYDGSPSHPSAGAAGAGRPVWAAGGRATAGERDGAVPTDLLWELAERTGITCLGTSAGFLTAAMKEDAPRAADRSGPGQRFELSRLRAVGSTGSPLPEEGFEWVYERLKRDVWLYSTSGGTDVCTAFVGGCPLLPVRAGELQCRALGCAVEAFDEQGRSVVDEVGELVVTEPMPSMPLYLWGDESGERYRESYFATYPGVWRHGDWIRITPRGSAVIYGRSDATINRGGVRMGTSEIYRAAGALQEVVDTLVVDLPEEDRSRMVLFVVLRDGLVLDESLRGAIARRIREDCSPRHVPDEVLQVEAVPRTLSGKILEVPVKRILMGAVPEEAVSLDSLANPEALEQFIALARARAVRAQSGPGAAGEERGAIVGS